MYVYLASLLVIYRVGIRREWVWSVGYNSADVLGDTARRALLGLSVLLFFSFTPLRMEHRQE